MLIEHILDQFDMIIIDNIQTGYGVNIQGDIINFVTKQTVSGSITQNGKVHVTLCYRCNNKKIHRRISVDHIVAQTFIPNPNKYKYVGHYDNDPLNCHVENLYWTYQKEKVSAGYSAEDIIEIFNGIRDNIDTDLILKLDDWVKIKFQCIIMHMKQQFNTIDGNILLTSYKKICNDNVISDRYEISPFGIIRNCNTNRYTFGHMSNHGYPMFISDIMGPKKPIGIHRLVAQTFIPNPQNKPEVHHLNSQKIDSCVWNLIWVTRQENMNYGLAMNECPSGENCAKAKYTNDQIHEVCKLIDMKIYSPDKISEMTGVSKRTIKSIREGCCWRQIAIQYDIPYCIYDKDEQYVGVNNIMRAKTKRKLEEYKRKRNIIIPELYN